MRCISPFHGRMQPPPRRVACDPLLPVSIHSEHHPTSCWQVLLPPSTISNPFICSYHPINHLVEESESPRPGHRTCSSALYAHGGRLCEVHGRRIDGKVERREREKLTHSLWIMSSCPCPDDRRRTNKQTTKARLCNPMLGFCSCSLYPFVYFRLLWPFFFFFASNFYCRSSEA